MPIRKNWQLLTLLIIIIASIRGIFVYHLAFSPNLTYALSATSIFLLSLFTIKYIFYNAINDKLKTFRKAVMYNYLFLIIYTFFYIVFVGTSEISIVYFFILFPYIFLLIKFEFNYLENSIHIISFVALIGTYIFYQLGVNFGFDAIEAANLTLRPGDLSYSRIGENILPGGYLGSHHDNANLLIMSTIFYFSLAIESDKNIKYFYWLIFFVFITFTILTGSASNILALFIVLLMGIILYSKKLLLLIIPIAIYNYDLFQEKFYFLEKIKQDQGDLEAGGIFNSLNFESLLKSAHSILFGGGYYFEVPMIRSEVAFVKILIGFGILPFLILMFILFSPLYYCYLYNKKCKIKISNNLVNLSEFEIKKLNDARSKYLKKLILSSLPILTGTISLLHYGSLFRITSIGFFCLFMSLFYKKFLCFDTTFDNLLTQNSTGH